MSRTFGRGWDETAIRRVLPLWLCMLLIVPVETTAQSSREDVARGVRSCCLRAGAILSWVGPNTSSSFDVDPRVGFTGGLFVDVAVTGVWSVQGEALYSQKGYSGSSVGYGELPILLKARVPGERARRPYVIAGPVVGLQTSEPRRLDAGVVVGIGVELFRDPESPFTFGLDVRYGVGLRSVDATSGLKNRWISVTLTTGLPMPT